MSRARRTLRGSPRAHRGKNQPMNLILAVIGALLTVVLLWRRRRRSHMPAQAMIVSPRRSTVVAGDGTVRSVQTAELSISEPDFEQLWTAANLENLARTYWRFLSRVTLGLIRVVYGADERRVVLLVKQLTLLRFEAPEYVLEADHGKVSWRITDGLLVARAGRSGSGYLALDVQREPELSDGRVKLRIEVEVANFYPSIASAFSTPVYTATQAVIHVLVTHAFLRSLARLKLAQSVVKRLAPDDEAPPASGSDGFTAAAPARAESDALRAQP